MYINELFENIEEEFHPEELNGEFTLEKNTIVWSYYLNDEIDGEVIIEDEDNFLNFEAASNEELLQEAYQEDLEKLQEYLDEIEETENWEFSDFETTDDNISFNISSKKV